MVQQSTSGVLKCSFVVVFFHDSIISSLELNILHIFFLLLGLKKVTVTDYNIFFLDFVFFLKLPFEITLVSCHVCDLLFLYKIK